MFSTAARYFSNTYKVTVEGEGEELGYLNPLLAVAEVINVSRPDQTPDMENVQEDVRLLDRRMATKTGVCASLWVCLCVGRGRAMRSALAAKTENSKDRQTSRWLAMLQSSCCGTLCTRGSSSMLMGGKVGYTPKKKT